jgi:hypothetical protein
MSYPQAVADKYTGGKISSYYTPLHDAAGEGDIDKIKFCLDHGMDVNLKHDGWTPLTSAAQEGKLNAVKYLIEHGADPKIKTLGKLPVWYAEQKGHSEVVAYLKSLAGAAPASKAKTAANAGSGTGAAGAASGTAKAATTLKKSKKASSSPYDAYIEKVDALLNRLVEDDDAISKVVTEFNKLGELYFKSSSSGYINPGDEAGSFKKLTKSQFLKEFEDMTGGDKPFNSEASFSDAFRHAGLIDIETFKMYPFEHAGVPHIDHVLSWPAVTNLPELLAGTNLVALHGDTEDGLQFFFPVPTKPRAAPGTAKAASAKKARKSRRARRS